MSSGGGLFFLTLVNVSGAAFGVDLPGHRGVWVGTVLWVVVGLRKLRGTVPGIVHAAEAGAQAGWKSYSTKRPRCPRLQAATARENGTQPE